MLRVYWDIFRLCLGMFGYVRVCLGIVGYVGVFCDCLGMIRVGWGYFGGLWGYVEECKGM